MPELESLTFDITMNTAEFEQGAQNIEAVLRQLMGGAFQSLAQAVEGIAQNLLGVVGNGNAMGNALTQSGDAATNAIQNVTKATRNTEAQTQATTSRISALWETAARRISFSMKSAMSSFVGPLAAVFGIHQLFSQYTGTADRLGKMADSLNMNIEDIQGWSEAAIRAGGSAEGFQMSLRSLNRQLQMMAATGKKGGKKGGAGGGMMGGGLGALLQEMKINPKENGKTKDIFQLLTEIAGGAEKMDKQAFAGLAMRSRIDQGTIQLLQKGREEVERLIAKQKALGVYTKEDAKIAAEFKDALADLTQVFKMTAAVILRAVTPVLSSVAKVLTDLILVVRQHGDAIKTVLLLLVGKFIYGVYPILIVAFKDIKRRLIELAALYLLKIKTVATQTVVSLKAITISVATLKAAFMSLFSLLASFVLPFVIEDIFSFFQGKVSYTGDFVYWLKSLPKKIKEMVDKTVKWVKEAAEDIKKFFVDLWNKFLDEVTKDLPEPVRKMLGVGRTKEEQAKVDAVKASVENARQQAQKSGTSLMDSGDPRDNEPLPKQAEPETQTPPVNKAAKTTPDSKKDAPLSRQAKPEPNAHSAVKAPEKAPSAYDNSSMFSFFGNIADKLGKAIGVVPVEAMASQSAANGVSVVNNNKYEGAKVKADMNIPITNNFYGQQNPEDYAGKFAPVVKKAADELNDLLADHNPAVNVSGGGTTE